MKVILVFPHMHWIIFMYISFPNRLIYSLAFKTNIWEVGQPTACKNIIQHSFYVVQWKGEAPANPQFLKRDEDKVITWAH